MRTAVRLMLLGFVAGCGGHGSHQPDAAQDGSSGDVAGPPDATADAMPDGPMTPPLTDPVAQPCSGLIGFPGIPLLEGGDTISQFVFADLNGDGKQDLALATAVIIQVALGRGDGTYDPPQNLSFDNTTGNHAIAVGDTNGDNRPDVVFSNNSQSGVYIQINNGNETYASPVFYDMGLIPERIAVEDINGDGKRDLLAFRGSTYTIAVRLATATGFAATASYPTNDTNAADIAFADLNGDNRLDAVVTNTTPNAPSVSIVLNNGNGTFASPTRIAIQRGANSPIVADLNNDGYADIALPFVADPHIGVLLNQGNGTFGTRVDYDTGTAMSIVSVTAGDVDGDGDRDLVIGNSRITIPWYDIVIVPNDGSGALGTARLLPTMQQPPASITVRDVNGDGKNDLITAQGRFAATDLGTAAAPWFLTRSELEYPTQLVSARMLDINSDGKRDLIMAAPNSVSPLVSLRLQEANGFAASTTDVPVTANPLVTGVADFNKDGRTDLLGLAADTGTQVLLNNGDGTLTGLAAFSLAGNQPHEHATGDVDKDGALDLVVSSDAGVQLFRGLGDGTFATPQLVWDGTGKTLYGLALGDVDGDGNLDLVVDAFTSTSTVLDVLRGTGSGTFQMPVSITNARAGRLALRDLDKDAHLDLIEYGLGNGVAVQLGAGTGTFAAATSVGAPSRAGSEVAFGDVDGDGNLDMVVEDASYPNGNIVTLLRGNGDGTFKPRLVYPAGIGLRSLAMADADNDGRLDIAVDNGNIASVLWGHCWL